MLDTAIVGKKYQRDTETEKLITGGELRDGMVVLIGDEVFRWDETALMGHEIQKSYLRKMNRWCEVTNLHIYECETETGISSSVMFIGVYGDGSTIIHRVRIETPWIVKKETMLVNVGEGGSREG